jgi:hypothetical protein
MTKRTPPRSARADPGLARECPNTNMQAPSAIATADKTTIPGKKYGARRNINSTSDSLADGALAGSACVDGGSALTASDEKYRQLSAPVNRCPPSPEAASDKMADRSVFGFPFSVENRAIVEARVSARN